MSDPDSGSVQHDAVLFATEDGGWKVTREQFSEKPHDEFVMYAFLEPDDGAFARGGSPWKPVQYASVNTQIVRKEEVIWKIQAIRDGAFVYEASPIPAAGSKVRPEIGKAGKTGGPPPPQPMRIKVSMPPLENQREYVISVSALVATTEAPDSKAKPANTYAVTYSLFVKSGNGDDVFESTLGDGSASKMLSVHDRFVDVKIPLAGFAVDPTAQLKVDLEEGDSVQRVLPYQVEPFAR